MISFDQTLKAASRFLVWNLVCLLRTWLNDMSKTYYKASNSTLDSVVTLPSFEVNVLKGNNKIMMIKTTDNIGEVEMWSWKKQIYDHSQPFRWFKKGSCQLLVKDWALSTGKLPRRLAKEQCGWVNWPRPKWPKMYRRAIKHQHNQPASVRWNMQGKELLQYYGINYIKLQRTKRVDGSWNAFVGVEKPYILNIWVCWQQKCSLMSIKHPKHPRFVTYATKIVQRKQKRLFDGNGMNSLSIISCKDTKHGAQVTLIDKNVIWKQSYRIMYYCSHNNITPPVTKCTPLTFHDEKAAL